MTYNILESGEGRIDPLAEAIRLAGAEVVVVQECWDEGLFHKLADRLGMDCFRAEKAGNGQSGVGILSKLKLREAVNCAAVDGRFTRGAFYAVVEWGEGELPVVGVHLRHGEMMADEEVRLGELGALMEVVKNFSGVPHVVAGDFNTYHPQQVIDVSKCRPSTREKVVGQRGEFPRKVVRGMLEAGYVDAHALHHSPEDFGKSFTTAYLASRVDYVFVTPDLCPRVKGCEVFMPAIGRYASDHYPVVMELSAED